VKLADSRRSASGSEEANGDGHGRRLARRSVA
jgi:hypothetical protein